MQQTWVLHLIGVLVHKWPLLASAMLICIALLRWPAKLQVPLGAGTRGAAGVSRLITCGIVQLGCSQSA